GFDAILGHFRTASTGVSGQRVAAGCNGARGRGAGVDLGLGTLRWQVRPHHRHEDIRRLSSAQGTPTEIRVRAGPGEGDRERAAWQDDMKHSSHGYPDLTGLGPSSMRR